MKTIPRTGQAFKRAPPCFNSCTAAEVAWASWRLRETILLMAVHRDNPLGLYISFPFCRSKCTYCNFASGVYPARDHERYVARVLDDLHATPAWAAQRGLHLPRRVDSVYFGGGTPSLLSPTLLRQLFSAMRA